MTAPITLKVYRGQELLRSEQFSRDIIKIGRLSSAHLCLDDDRVSRIHSVIEIAADGGLSIIDMGSAEGTFVNGKRVSKGSLQSGDQITLGGLKVVVEQNGASAPAAASSAARVPVAQSRGDRFVAEMNSAIDEMTGDEVPSPVFVPVAAPPPEPVAEPKPIARVTPAAREARQSDGEPGVAVREPEPAPRKAKRPALEPEERPVQRASPGSNGAGARSATSKRRRAILSESTEDTSDMGVELRMLWGSTLLDAGMFVRPSSPVLGGATGKCRFLMVGSDIPSKEFPVLRFDDGEYHVYRFTRGMSGDMHALTVPSQGTVTVDYGSGIRIEATTRHPPKPAILPWREGINYNFLNVFLILFFFMGGLIVAANNFAYEVDTLADDLYRNPSRMLKYLAPTEQPKPTRTAQKLEEKLKGENPGEMAEKHKGTEGRMGRKDAKVTNGRSAPKAIDPNDKNIVKNSGLLAALGRGRGASGGLSTVFGTGGLGGDLKGAIGNMFGPVVGDSYGLGGLGIKGSGTGGGGMGETIGIGGVGTKGAGGGLGSFGKGAGNLGAKRNTNLSIETGRTDIVGSIDPELVRKVVRDHASQIRYCYEQQLAVNPKIEGKVAIRWQINSDGSASELSVESGETTLADRKVHECMISRIRTWTFPKPKGGGIALIKYPWILRVSGVGG